MKLYKLDDIRIVSKWQSGPDCEKWILTFVILSLPPSKGRWWGCLKKLLFYGLPDDGDTGYQVRDHVVNGVHEVFRPEVDQPPLKPVAGSSHGPLEVLRLLAHPPHSGVNGATRSRDDVVQAGDPELWQLQVPERPDDRRRRRCVQDCRQHHHNQCAQCKLHSFCLSFVGCSRVETKATISQVSSVEFIRLQEDVSPLFLCVRKMCREKKMSVNFQGRICGSSAK